MKLSRFIGIISVNFNLCVMSIISNKIRTIITTFGIFLGVGALLFNVAFMRGMDDDLKKSLQEIGGLNIVTIRATNPDTRKTMFKRSIGLSNEEAKTLVSQLSYNIKLLPFRNLGWINIAVNGHSIHAHAKAVGPQHTNVYNYKIEIGRAFDEENYDKNQLVCVIGKQVASRLFNANTNPIGREIQLDRYKLKIIGLIHTETLFHEKSNEILFPYSVWESKFGSRFTPQNEVSLLLENPDIAPEVQVDLRKRLLEMHRGVEDFVVEINKDKIAEIKSSATGVKVLLASIAAISLLVGGISIMNIMFATIGDQIREIGIRKAMGATHRDIFIQFIIEAILVSLAGGIPGIFLGTLVTLVPVGLFPFNPHLMLSDYLIAILFTIVVGVFAGIFPSIHAANMQPVEALSY